MSLDPAGSPIHRALGKAEQKYSEGDRAAAADSLQDAVVASRGADAETKHVTWQSIASLVHGHQLSAAPEQTAGKGGGPGGWWHNHFGGGGGKGSPAPSGKGSPAPPSGKGIPRPSGKGWRSGGK